MSVTDYRILLHDENGFRRIFDSYYPRLLRFAKEYVSNPDDVKDILQNVFLTLLERKAALRVDTNLSAYLLTLVKSECLDFLKHKKVADRYIANQMTVQQQEMAFNYYAISKFEPEQMDIESLERLAEKAISELPEQCRKVFELSRYDGLKYKEIAERMGISVKTVETHMSHALKILRVTLKDSFLVWFFYVTL